MKKVKLINVKGAHISNETGLQVNVSFEESVIDQMVGSNKFTYIELYTCLATFCGKTLKEIWSKVDAFAKETGNYDFNAVVIK